MENCYFLQIISSSIDGPDKRIVVHTFIALSVALAMLCSALLICMLRVIKPGVELTRSKGMPKSVYIFHIN